jgi:hypothetical protein
LSEKKTEKPSIQKKKLDPTKKASGFGGEAMSA